jgi:hypothetical protein
MPVLASGFSALVSFLLLWYRVISQCFVSDFPQDTFAYSRDNPAFDLYTMASGDLLSFKLEKESPLVEISNTFMNFESKSTIGVGITNCYQYTTLNNTHYAFLCNPNKLVFLEFSELDGSITMSRTFSIDNVYQCQSVSASRDKGEVYLACLSNSEGNPPNLSLLVVEISIPSLRTIVTTAQTEDAQITRSINSTAVNIETDLGTISLIYIYEGGEGPVVKFRIFKNNIDGFISDGGYFSVPKGNIIGVKPNTRFAGFFQANGTLALVLRDNQNTVFLQKCYPSPVNSNFNCIPDSVANLQINDQYVYFASSAPVNPDLNIPYILVVASKTRFMIFSFYPQRLPFTAVFEGEYPLQSANIGSLIGIYTWAGKLYLTGKTDNNENMIILYRLTAGNYEMKVYSTDTYDISFIRRGTYDTDVDEHIAIAGSTSYVSQIYKPELLLYPNQQVTSIQATVLCYLNDVYQNKRDITVQVMQYVNSNVTIDLPKSINAYAGSRDIAVPICTDDIAGNAPFVFGKSADQSERFRFRVDYERPLTDAGYYGDDIYNITDFRFIASGLFVITNTTTINVITCFAETEEQGGCFPMFTMPFIDSILIDAELVGNLVIILTSSSKGGPLGNQNVLVFTGYDISDSSLNFTHTFVGYKSTVGLLRNQGSTLFAYITGYQPGETLTQRVMMLSTNFTMDLPATFTPVFEVPPHMCIIEMGYAPRGLNTLYLASACNTTLSSRIYELIVNNLTPNKTTLRSVYSDLGTTDFTICPTGRGLNVIDFQNAQIFGYDIGQTEDYRFKYPLREYNMTKIVDYHCDQENQIIQIVATNSESTSYKVLTYRGEKINEPNERVHSITATDIIPKFITSTFNDIGDEMNTILLEGDTTSLRFFKYYIGAPYVTLDAGEVKNAGMYTLTYYVSYPGENGTIYSVVKNQTLNLLDQQINIGAFPVDGKNAFPKGSNIILDDYIAFSGPIVKIEMNNVPGLSLIDRFSPSDRFKTTTEVFDKSLIDGDYIFGYYNGQLKLVLNNQVILSYDVTEVLNIDSVGGQQGFFALVIPTTGINNQIVAFINVNNQWKIDRYVLYSGDFEYMIFFKSPSTGSNDFVYAGYINTYYRIELGLLRIRDNELHLVGPQAFVENDGNIIDFDAEILSNQKYFVVISCEEQSKLAKFSIFSIDKDSGVIYENRQLGSLIPGVETIHNEIDFSCWLNQAVSNVMTCMHNEENYESFLIDYSFSLANIKSQFVTSSIVRTFKNLKNFKPIRSVTTNGYAAVTLKNLDVQPKTQGNIFSEEYLLAIYSAVYQEDPYRIITYSELGLQDAVHLQNLEPFFFTDNTGTGVKLGINVGTSTSSIRVFNIDTLRLVVSNSNSALNTVNLQITQVDGTVKSVPFTDLFAFPNPEPDKPKKSHKTFYIILAIIILVVLIGTIIFYLKFMRGEEENDAEDAYKSSNNKNVSKFDSENTIKADDTAVNAKNL